MTNTKYNLGDILEIQYGEERRIWDGMQVCVTAVDTKEPTTWYHIRAHTARIDGMYQPGYDMGAIKDDDEHYILKYRAVQPEPETIEDIGNIKICADSTLNSDQIDGDPIYGFMFAADDGLEAWVAADDGLEAWERELIATNAATTTKTTEEAPIFYADVAVTVGSSPDMEVFILSREGTEEAMREWVESPLSAFTVDGTDLELMEIVADNGRVTFLMSAFRSMDSSVHAVKASER